MSDIMLYNSWKLELSISDVAKFATTQYDAKRENHE